MTQPVQWNDEQPDTPILGEHPRIAVWHHRYRWVLYLFVVAVLAGLVYVGWRIVDAWEALMDQVLGG